MSERQVAVNAAWLANLVQENERLRALVKEAYDEGVFDGHRLADNWAASDVKAELGGSGYE